MSEDLIDGPPPPDGPPPDGPPPEGSSPVSGEDWPARVEQLLAEAEAATAASDRAAILCRVAEIYERRIGDPAASLVTLQAALEQDPASGRVVQEMERVARGNGRWPEIIAVTAEVAAGLPDKKQSADLWVQIAFWNESGLAALDEAANAARAALELSPNHGGALALLEDLYKRQRSWDRYVEILARKRETPNDDPYKLLDAYREVLRYEPQHPGALDGVARIYEESSQWESAADALRKLIASAPDDGVRLAVRHRLGTILKDRLKDSRGAEEQLVEALATPGGEGHVPSLLALAAIYRDRKDWLKARQLLGRAAVAVLDPNERVRLLLEAADICADKLDDQAQAADLYAEVVAADPTRIDVVDKLAAIRFRRGDWAELLPLAEYLVAKAEGQAPGAAPVEGGALEAPETAAPGSMRPASERARLWYQLGRACEGVGDDGRAVDAYLSALTLQPTGDAALGARRDLAALTFRRESWTDAATAYEALLSGHGPALKRNETLDAYERLGIAYFKAGEPARAIAPLEKALALDPRRRVALETIVEAAKAAGDDDAVVRHSQALLAVTEDPNTKRELLEAVATIHRDRRKDPQRAIAAYMAALEVWPDERSIMHRLLELLTETKQWKQAVQLLIRLAEQLPDKPDRAPYYVAAGVILAEELHATGDAIDAFERALDSNPTDLKSFERIDKLVTAARDWKTQERSYRRQIKRMGTDVPPEQRPALLALWHGLGEIYRTRLKDYKAAIAAFEVARGLDPDSIERRRILAELYRLAGPETYPKAIAEHRALVHRAANLTEMTHDLKTMVRIFVEMGALEEAYAVAAVLSIALQADPDEKALYQQYRPRGVLRAHGRLTEDLWQRLIYHRDEDRALSQMLATLSPVVALARAKAAKELGLKRKQRRDINTDPTMVCKAFAYGCDVLGVTTPEVFLLPESPGELEVANIRVTVAGSVPTMPALVLGRKLLETQSDIELAFIVGRTLASLRPDHLLRWPSFVPTLAELEIVFHATARMVDSSRPVPPEIAGEVEKYAGFLSRTVPPQLLEQLTVLVRRLAAAHEDGPIVTTAELARWARAACLTTIRAGFLLSGDLEVAARLGSSLAVAVGIEPADVVRDLCEWSVSEAYTELRAQLGLQTVNLGYR